MTASVCPECAVRPLLLARLAGHIATTVDRGAGRRARDLLSLGDEQLAAAVTRSDPGRAESALEHSRGRSALRELAARLESSGCWMLCRHDALWPAELERLQAAEPQALFGRGERSLAAAERGAVTIVGARRAGSYGREVAESLGYGLGATGVCVVSGLALGIDKAAHEGTVLAGGPGLAVLGAGPDRAYPRSAARLYRDLVAGGGAVISELPPGCAVRRWMFPARNRVMAALGEITVVIEAAERSGSLITTEMALDCGRVVGAVPGPVNSWRSSGTNRLLVDGATPIRDAADVLEHLHSNPRCSRDRDVQERLVPQGPPLETRERVVLDEIERGAQGADAISQATGIAAAGCVAALARLELAGYVEIDFAGRCRRTLLAAPAPAGRSGGEDEDEPSDGEEDVNTMSG